jgi:hypothetical protein
MADPEDRFEDTAGSTIACENFEHQLQLSVKLHH